MPQKKGFDEFVGYLENVHAHNYYPTFLWRYDPATGFDDKLSLLENQGGAKGLYIPDLCTKAALNFVRINKPDQFILALVQVQQDDSTEVRYLRQPFQGSPRLYFNVAGVDFEWTELWNRARNPT